MKRDKVIERLKAGETMFLNCYDGSYFMGGETIRSDTAVFLRTRKLVVLVKQTDHSLHFRWSGDVPGHSPAKSE